MDSNPRYMFWPVCSLIRGVPSTTRPSLRSYFAQLEPQHNCGRDCARRSLSAPVAGYRAILPARGATGQNKCPENSKTKPSHGLRRLFQLEHAMELPHRELQVLLVDYHRGLDLGGRNHL